MKKFKKVDKSMPGHLVFFEGQVGSFGLIVLSIGESEHSFVKLISLHQVSLPHSHQEHLDCSHLRA